MNRSTEKLIIGPRIRRLRQSLGLTQTKMAQDLEISASYLNLIERNQRAVSAKVLLKIAETYELDMSELAGQSDQHLVGELFEAVRDPLFRDMPVSKSEAEDLVSASPNAARVMLKLYRRHRDLAKQASTLTSDSSGAGQAEQPTEAVEAVRQFLQRERNFFPELDAAAEDLSEELNLKNNPTFATLTDRLKEHHFTRVRVLSIREMPKMLRYHDRHDRRIDLSELLRASGRMFQLAFQIGMLEQRELIDRLVSSARLADRNAQWLCRTSLANYFAAALLMPYGRFLAEAKQTRYDVELLSHRFGTSFEQTAHRLTTLQKPDARGVPFFFIRIDIAGNVTKRFSTGKFQFSQFGGTCPLWNIHEAFLTPGRIVKQVIQMPDDTSYLSIAKMVSRTDGTYNNPEQKFSVALGCDIAHADQLTYGDGYNFDVLKPTPVGVNCYLCDRANCLQRAHAPLNKSLNFDERARSMSLFRFNDDSDA